MRARKLKAYAELGSHGKPFAYVAGPVYERCGDLMQIYATPGEGRTPVTILIPTQHRRKKNARD